MGEKKSEKSLGGLFWLLPVAAFLVVGGLIAMISMKDAAEKLSGRTQAGDLSSSGGPFAGRGASDSGAHEFFSSDENIPDEALASYESHKSAIEDRLYEKTSTGKVTAFSGAVAGPGGVSGGDSVAGRSPSSGHRGASGPAPRLASGLNSFKGAKGGSAKSSLGAAGASSFGGRGGKPAVVSASGETGVKKGSSRSGGGGVIEALRSAWRGSVMGARDASNDAARTLVARSFDGSASSERLSLEYDEKMKKELDVVSPDSIPKFLRDQDLSADRASAYDVPEIKGVKVDKKGTEDALKEDKAYQDTLASMANGMINPMFSGVTNTNGAGGTETEEGTDDSGGAGLFSIPDTPQDDEWMYNLYNEDIIDTNGGGCGEECGCSCDAPCCCLPDAAPTGCPMYGPFLPDDPCGSDFGTPFSGDGGIWV